MVLFHSIFEALIFTLKQFCGRFRNRRVNTEFQDYYLACIPMTSCPTLDLRITHITTVSDRLSTLGNDSDQVNFHKA